MKQDPFLQELRLFVRNDLPGLHLRLQAPLEVADDEPLFETGILDSLAVVHLVTYLEARCGRPLNLQEVSMESFRSLQAIAERFAGEIK